MSAGEGPSRWRSNPYHTRRLKCQVVWGVVYGIAVGGAVETVWPSQVTLTGLAFLLGGAGWIAAWTFTQSYAPARIRWDRRRVEADFGWFHLPAPPVSAAWTEVTNVGMMMADPEPRYRLWVPRARNARRPWVCLELSQKEWSEVGPSVPVKMATLRNSFFAP